MKTLLLGSIAAALAAGAAGAADLPMRRAPPVYPPPIPAFSFTGLYIGGQVGYGFGRDRDVYGPEVTGLVIPYGSSPKGVIGGGHAGYLFSTQSLPVIGALFGGFGSGGVIGFEGDVDGLSGSGRTDVGALIPGGLPNTFFSSIRSNIQGSVRGRLGIAVDRLLFYATGGAAFADFRTNYTDSRFSGAGGINDTFQHSRVGYTVGGGIEYAFRTNISARIEYRYSDFGSFSDPTAFSGVPSVVRHRETAQRVQVGLSYHFATPMAVVARY